MTSLESFSRVKNKKMKQLKQKQRNPTGIEKADRGWVVVVDETVPAAGTFALF